MGHHRTAVKTVTSLTYRCQRILDGLWLEDLLLESLQLLQLLPLPTLHATTQLVLDGGELRLDVLPGLLGAAAAVDAADSVGCPLDPVRLLQERFEPVLNSIRGVVCHAG